MKSRTGRPFFKGMFLDDSVEKVQLPPKWYPPNFLETIGHMTRMESEISIEIKISRIFHVFTRFWGIILKMGKGSPKN